MNFAKYSSISSLISIPTWIKQYAQAAGDLVPEASGSGFKVVELDELHTYCGVKKNYSWIWVAVDRFAKRFITCICGDRFTQTGLKIWDALKTRHVETFYTDHWKSYCEFPPLHLHIQDKKQTYTIEGYNNRIRHYLARFKRKTKCYSKSQDMMILSLKLLFLKLNHQLTILN